MESLRIPYEPADSLRGQRVPGGNKSFYIWLLRGTEAEAILYICFYKMYGRIVPVFFVNSVIISVKV